MTHSFPRIGVVTPTNRRGRFIKEFVDSLRRQSHPNWRAAIVHDGPCHRFRRVVAPLHKLDRRLHLAESPKKSADAGASIRLACANWLEQQSVDYLVFWDDDNFFYPHALASIAKDLAEQGFPSLLVEPIRFREGRLPRTSGTLKRGQIDHANLVVEVGCAIKALRTVVQDGRQREQDWCALQSILASGCRPAFGASTVGVYDGLRPGVHRFGSSRLAAKVFYWSVPSRLFRSARHRLIGTGSDEGKGAF